MDDNPKTILWNYHPTQVHLCLPMNRLGRGRRINALPSCRRGSRTRRAGGGGCLTFWLMGWRLIRGKAELKAEFKSVGADRRKYGISSKHNRELNSEFFRPVKQNETTFLWSKINIYFNHQLKSCYNFFLNSYSLFT